MPLSRRARAVKYLWDVGCVLSIVGIWPRFIEPNIISTTHLSLPIARLPSSLCGLKIAQFSDLHMSSSVTDSFLKRVSKKINSWQPDLIVFTGDFLCHSHIYDGSRMRVFLTSLRATHGCYCVFGNHDYQAYVAVNSSGEYDVVAKVPIDQFKGIKRIFCGLSVTGEMSPRLKEGLDPHQELSELIGETQFQILENQSACVKIGDSAINVVGVGEYIANCFDAEKAFKNYDARYPGIVLAHNPDGIPRLLKHPGDVILCGHVHGGQINLPWLRKRFVVLENPQYVRGTFHEGERWIHINRGLGATLRFRLLASPELTFITLHGET